MHRSIAVALLLAVSSSGLLAQEQESYLRLQLPAPLLMSGGSGGQPAELGVGLASPFPANATVGDVFESAVTVTGGLPGYVTFADGEPPHGIDFSNRMAAGTFGAAGDYLFRVGVRDSAGAEAFTDPVPVSVQLPLAASHPDWRGIAVTGETMAAPPPLVSGGLPGYSFTLLGDVPGLSMDASGNIAFVPSAVGDTPPFGILVEDSIGREAKVTGLTINVADPVTLSYASASYEFTAGEEASIAAPTTAGGRGIRTVHVVEGALPGNVELAADGSASGSPATVPPSGTVVLEARDADGRKSAPVTLAWTVTPKDPLQVTRWLAVGGGGGGGGPAGPNDSWAGGGGGGGGGGVVGSDWDGAFPLLGSGETLEIVIGAGGLGQKGEAAPTGGEPTLIRRTSDNIYIAYVGGGAQGGRGGSSTTPSAYNARTSDDVLWGMGGGGGGMRGAYKSGSGSGHPSTPVAAKGKTRNGYVGGRKAEVYTNSGGGGGGASEAGGLGVSGTRAIVGGKGGNGLSTNITGTTIYVGQGGGGGSIATYGYQQGGNAGDGSYANGGGFHHLSDATMAAGSGAANRGQGGGGEHGRASRHSISAGDGSAGIVVLRYPGPQRATGGTVTTVGGDTVHVFTQSGQFTVN